MLALVTGSFKGHRPSLWIRYASRVSSDISVVSVWASEPNPSTWYSKELISRIPARFL